MKQLKIVLFTLILFSIIFIAGCTKADIPQTTTIQTTSSTESTISSTILSDVPLGNLKAICEGDGGTWTTFPDGRADICGAGGGAAIITDSCECGIDKCWYTDVYRYKCVPEITINNIKHVNSYEFHKGCVTDNDCSLVNIEANIQNYFDCCYAQPNEIDQSSDDWIAINNKYMKDWEIELEAYKRLNCQNRVCTYAQGTFMLINQQEAKCIQNICAKIPK